MSLMSSSSALEARTAIERTGFHLSKDTDEESQAGKVTGKGKRFAQFYNAGYYTKTPQGLDFVFQNTLGDTEIRSIVLSIIAQPRWGYLRYFSTRLSPEYAWFFHNRDESTEHEAIHTLLVQFWMPGSRVVYYEGSQSQFFDAKEDPDNWGVLKTPLASMKRKNVSTRKENMPNGGYTIIDSRLGWTCEDGGFMNIGFGSDEEVAKWGQMELPDSGAIRAKVAELESKGFRTNFTYVKLNVSGMKND